MAKKVSKTKAIAYILLIFFLVTLVTHSMRSYKVDALIGQEQYFNLRIAQEVSEKGIWFKDVKLYDAPSYKLNIVHLLLSIFNNKTMYMKIIPFLLGVASLILFYLLMTHFKVLENTKFLSSVLLIISPPFIYATVTYTTPIFLIFFLLTFSFLYIKKQILISLIPSILLLLINPLYSIFIVFTIFFLEALKPVNRKKGATLSLFLLLSSLLSYIFYYYPKFVPNFLFFETQGIFASTLSDFGAVGIGVFQLLLGIIGITLLWNKKPRFLKKNKNYRSLFVFLIMLFIVSAYIHTIIYLINIVVSILVAFTLSTLYMRKWELKPIRKLAVMLIAYGLIFSAFSFQTRIVNSSPLPSEIDALNLLGEEQEAVTLSHYSNGYLIEHFSKKPVLLDNRLFFSKKRDEINSDADKIFSSRNLENTKGILNRYQIKYVYIDKDMKEGQIWQNREEGLLFLLDNSDDFDVIFWSHDVEVWKVTNSTA